MGGRTVLFEPWRSLVRRLIFPATAILAFPFCGNSQIEGSAGQTDTKPFTATVAIREGYDSNPLTAS